MNFLAVVVVAGGLALLLRGSPLLSIGPRVVAGPGWLMATSSLPAMLLSLFSYSRAVHVDAAANEVHVRSRYLWLCRWHKVIRFGEVEKILYFLDDLSPATLIRSSRFTRLGYILRRIFIRGGRDATADFDLRV